jgi:hypothetical protein
MGVIARMILVLVVLCIAAVFGAESVACRSNG